MLKDINITSVIEKYEEENNVKLSEVNKKHFINIIKKIDNICECTNFVYDETLGLFLEP